MAAARTHRLGQVCVGKFGRRDRLLSDQQFRRLGNMAYLSSNLEWVGALLRRSHSVLPSHAGEHNHFFNSFVRRLRVLAAGSPARDPRAEELKEGRGQNYANLLISPVSNGNFIRAWFG